MATRATDRSTRKIWRARCRLDGTEVYLGNFPTRGEAEAVERAFRRKYPSRQGDPTIGMRPQGSLR